MTTLYERDFHAWAGEQAGLLRAGKLAEADLPHIIEEIESLGRGEKREFVDRLIVLLVHLLEWRYQPGLRGNAWRLSIEEQRIRLAAHRRRQPQSEIQARRGHRPSLSAGLDRHGTRNGVA